MVLIVLGVLLLLRGAFVLARTGALRTDERRRHGRRLVTALAIALVRGVGSVVLGIALIGKVFDLAIALAVALVLWEVGLRRRPVRQPR